MKIKYGWSTTIYFICVFINYILWSEYIFRCSQKVLLCRQYYLLLRNNKQKNRDLLDNALANYSSATLPPTINQVSFWKKWIQWYNSKILCERMIDTLFDIWEWRGIVMIVVVKVVVLIEIDDKCWCRVGYHSGWRRMW